VYVIIGVRLELLRLCVLLQNLKLSKQLESASVDHKSEISRLESCIQELTGELTLTTEAKSRLETQFEESKQRAALDADEQMSRLQNELQASSPLHAIYV